MLCVFEIFVCISNGLVQLACVLFVCFVVCVCLCVFVVCFCLVKCVVFIRVCLFCIGDVWRVVVCACVLCLCFCCLCLSYCVSLFIHGCFKLCCCVVVLFVVCGAFFVYVYFSVSLDFWFDLYFFHFYAMVVLFDVFSAALLFVLLVLFSMCACSFDCLCIYVYVPLFVGFMVCCVFLLLSL